VTDWQRNLQSFFFRFTRLRNSDPATGVMEILIKEIAVNPVTKNEDSAPGVSTLVWLQHNQNLLLIVREFVRGNTSHPISSHLHIYAWIWFIFCLLQKVVRHLGTNHPASLAYGNISIFTFIYSLLMVLSTGGILFRWMECRAVTLRLPHICQRIFSNFILCHLHINLHQNFKFVRWSRGHKGISTVRCVTKLLSLFKSP